jgi:hypothetical protein
MFKTLVICAVVSASVVACSTMANRSESGAPRPAGQAAAVACPQNSSASRLPQRPGACSSSPGRTYSNEDIQRTGQTDVASALQLLDPSISAHH